MSIEVVLPVIISALSSILIAYFTTGAAIRQGRLKDDSSAASQYADVAAKAAEQLEKANTRNAEQEARLREATELLEALKAQQAQWELDSEDWRDRNDGLIKRFAAMSQNYDKMREDVNKIKSELARVMRCLEANQSLVRELGGTPIPLEHV